MVKEPIRRANQNGVEIIISSDAKTFDVSINLSPEATKTQKFRCKDFIFKFQVLNGQECLNLPLHFETKNRRYRNSIINSGIALNYQKEGLYECKIYLRACLYAPDNMMKEIGQNLKRKGFSGSHSKKKSLGASSNQIHYCYTNVGKPYQGGSFSPK